MPVPVSVARLAAAPGLGLVIRTGRVGLAREVRWSAVSELTDPTPFLEGGELLLTTGMHLPLDPLALAGYLDRLVSARVAAFGLGVGLTFDAVPQPLVAAAEARGLPLIEVPRSTPFIALTRALADMLAAEQREEQSQALRVYSRLVDAALGPAPESGVLGVLARAVDGWAVLLDRHGALRAESGGAPPRVASLLGADVARLTAHGVHASAGVDVEQHHVVIQPVGAAGVVTGFLAVGVRGPLSPARRALVAGATSVLSLDPDRSRRAAAADAATRAVVVRLLLRGLPTEACEVAAAGGVTVPSGPVRLVLARGLTPGQLAMDGALVAELDGLAIALCPDRADLLAELSGRLAHHPRARAGIGAPAELPELAGRLDASRQALTAAEQSGRALVDAGAMGAVHLLGLLHPEALAAHAQSVLAPLASYGRNQEDLVASLRSWLEHGGHWDETAAALGVHRNTLRYRIRRVEELTGRDLGSMHDRVELWLALQALPAQRRPST